MAQTRTLVQMRTEVRQRADIENATTWIDNDEVDRYINEGLHELYDLMIEAHDHEYNLQEHTVTTTSGTAEYALETVGQGGDLDFYILKGVDIECDGGRYQLRPYSFLQREDGDNADQDGGKPSHYRIYTTQGVGTNKHYIRFQPTPNAAYTIKLAYIPSAPTLSGDNDEWLGFNGWEEYAIVDAAIRCLEKEESDTEALQVRKAKLEQRIRHMAGTRDWTFNERVTDVERGWGCHGVWEDPVIGGGR